jgi:hypothetical protein
LGFGRDKFMKLQNGLMVLTVAALVLAGWCAFEVHALQGRIDWMSGALRAQKGEAAGAAPSANVEERLKKLEAAAPGLGEIMSGLQIHAAKLYFAGKARNWPLVEFEIGEMEEALAAAPVVRPQDNNVPLAAVIDAFKNSQWAALKQAVTQRNGAAFDKAYDDVVLVCNACHQATTRPYLQIIPPTQPPVSNQRWEAGLAVH